MELVYNFLYVSNMSESRTFFEHGLGLTPVESDDYSVKYSFTNLLIGLNRTETPIPNGDNTSLIVIHADNLADTKFELESRGVAVSKPLRYEIGGTANFYSPDGHSFCLYEPSEEALSWPSGSKYKKIATSPRSDDGTRSLIIPYIFLFIRDYDTAYDFFGKIMGLSVIEVDRDSGVVKYDAGKVILSTHEVGGDSHTKESIALESHRSSALVFHTDDIQTAYERLKSNVNFITPIQRGSIGATVKFTGPDGHTFFLYEPSKEAMSWPSGAVLRNILNKEDNDCQ